MYDFLDLKLIRYISEEPSLSAVAARVRMSLPAVSQRLAKLEDDLQAKLVFRSGGFGLTPAGKILLQSANAIATEIDRMERQLRATRGAQAATLHIICTESTLIDDLPFVLDRLSNDHPALQIVITEEQPAGLPTLLSVGKVDIVLSHEVHPIQGVRLIEYRSERACIIAPLTHPLAQRTGPIYFKDTLAYDFVGAPGQRHLANFEDAISKAYSHGPHYRVRVNSLEAQCVLVGQTNLGIALTIEGPARRHARNQPIQVIRLADEWAVRRCYICISASGELSDAGKRFIELLQERFELDLATNPRI